MIRWIPWTAGTLGLLVLSGLALRWEDRSQAGEDSQGLVAGDGIAVYAGAPRVLPAFRLVDAEGVQHEVSSEPQCPVVVNFWATWCAPCVAELPELAATYEHFQGDGVAFYGLSLDGDSPQTPSRLASVARKTGVGYPVGRIDEALYAEFGSPKMLPVTLVYDGRGELVEAFAGMVSAAELRAAVERALRRSPAQA